MKPHHIDPKKFNAGAYCFECVSGCFCIFGEVHRVTTGTVPTENDRETTAAKIVRVLRDALEEIEDVLSNVPEHLQSALTRELQIRARNALIVADAVQD